MIALLYASEVASGNKTKKQVPKIFRDKVIDILIGYGIEV